MLPFFVMYFDSTLDVYTNILEEFQHIETDSLSRRDFHSCQGNSGSLLEVRHDKFLSLSFFHYMQQSFSTRNKHSNLYCHINEYTDRKRMDNVCENMDSIPATKVARKVVNIVTLPTNAKHKCNARYIEISSHTRLEIMSPVPAMWSYICTRNCLPRTCPFGEV
jgi:hypothetical protein